MRKYTKPLNPQLYEFLWQTTGGHVRVAKAGQHFRYSTKVVDGEKFIFKVPGGGGEEYAICCPLCGDQRYRCYVNHTFGTEVDGVEITNAIHCFNDNCQGLYKHMTDGIFAFYNDAGGTYAASSVAQEKDWDIESVAAEAAASHERLHGVQLLTRLAANHPANEYVLGRGFDPYYLVETFKVGYYRGVRSGLRNKRLIAPVFYKTNMVGWNARVIDGHTKLTPDPAKPGKRAKKWPWREGKYVNAPGYPKSLFLYNRDLALDYDVICVVEGITDVWRVGPWCVGIMGKSMSDMQTQMLVDIASARKAWVVMLGDGNSEKDDAASHWRMNFENFTSRYAHPERVRLHLFGFEDDPGAHSHSELNDIVTRVLHDKRID